MRDAPTLLEAPTLWETMAADPAVAVDPAALALVIADQRSRSRALLYPWIRPLSRLLVAVIVIARRLCPWQGSAHGLMDRAPLQAAVTRATLGDATQQLFVMRSLSLELWLRTVEELSSSSEATAPPGRRESQQPHTGGHHEYQNDDRTAGFVRSA